MQNGPAKQAQQTQNTQQTLKVNLPSSQTHPLVRVTVKTPKNETTTTLDDSHSILEIPIPREIREEQIEVSAQLCDAHGEPDKRMEPIVLKAANAVPATSKPVDVNEKKTADRPTEKSTEKPAAQPTNQSLHTKTDAPKSEIPQL